MKRRRDQLNDGVELPLTPLVDIVFLLLIYFLLASNFVQQQQFQVDLSHSKNGDALVPHPLVVTITRDGRYLLNHKEIREEALDVEFKGLSPGVKKGAGLVIRSHRAAPMEAAVRVMDAARQAGIAKVAIETRAEAVGR